jgi:DNA (cytosine-5)-methyltransferase 1
MRVLDLFSGAGGMSLGFSDAGFEVVAAADFWIDALETLKFNKPDTKTFHIDLSDSQEVENMCNQVGKIDLVIGGPPCQGFSIAGKRDPSDPRNRLYQGFVRAIKILNPRAFVMENVPTIASSTNIELFESIINDFVDLGYAITHKVLLASDFGVPQNRRRMFIVGLRDSATSFIFPTKMDTMVSSSEAISDLPENSASDGALYGSSAQSAYQSQMRKGSRGLYNHQITQHSAQTIETIALVPDGGNHKDLPLTKKGIRNVNIAWTRLNSARPSYTIDTGHRHHFHYLWDRVPTVRESARLQSFPDQFVFFGSKTSQYKQVGNAVPPQLARVIAVSLRNQIKEIG